MIPPKPGAGGDVVKPLYIYTYTHTRVSCVGSVPSLKRESAFPVVQVDVAYAVKNGSDSTLVLRMVGSPRSRKSDCSIPLYYVIVGISIVVSSDSVNILIRLFRFLHSLSPIMLSKPV